MTSGEDSPQYKAVLGQLRALGDALKITPDAQSSLQQEFQMKSWLSITVTSPASADQLIRTALTRIANDVKDYDVFIGMLQGVTGIKHIADKITSKLLLI